jgi:hypothetical protein
MAKLSGAGKGIKKANPRIPKLIPLPVGVRFDSKLAPHLNKGAVGIMARGVEKKSACCEQHADYDA